MKKYATIAILILLLIAGIPAMTACGEKEAPDDETTEYLTETVAVESTEEALPVSLDPMTAASRGLAFTSNGDGSCTLVGIGSCIDMCLIIPDMSDSGERVVKIAPSAFAGNTTITAVQIPAGVSEIGAGAFAGCQKLAYISVADGNNSYRDSGGILYSADAATLVCVPAGSSHASLTLTSQVKKIADNATEGCKNLKKIIYEGSKDNWKAVTIGTGNTSLTSAEFTYMTQTGK